MSIRHHLSAMLLMLTVGLLGCGTPQTSQGTNPERVIATVGNEPIYALEVERLVDAEVKRIRNAEGIFARPSPEEMAFLREAALHTLLLNAVYKQPSMQFSKSRAVTHTRELTLQRAREVRQALLDGKSTAEVLDKYIDGVYREPAQVYVDLLSTGQIQPAYRTEAFSTPAGEITDIIEDPSGGYYILRIVKKETLEGDVERVQADSFFIPFDKEAGRKMVKEEDLASSRVAITDPAMLAITRLREARDASAADDTTKEQRLLIEARAALEGSQKQWEKRPDVHFLLGWVTELQARDPSSGATFEQALEHYQKAAALQEQQGPGEPHYGYYLARVGEMQERLGRDAEARETYLASLEAAKDNRDLTLNLRAHFESLNMSEPLAKAEAELSRMGQAATYGKIQAGQKVLRTPGRLAEGVHGDAELFDVEGVSQIVE